MPPQDLPPGLYDHPLSAAAHQVLASQPEALHHLEPLDQALALLWQADAWREELRQLLLLLAERADHRLHSLPWALPVPLRVHGR